MRTSPPASYYPVGLPGYRNEVDPPDLAKYVGYRNEMEMNAQALSEMSMKDYATYRHHLLSPSGPSSHLYLKDILTNLKGVEEQKQAKAFWASRTSGPCVDCGTALDESSDDYPSVGTRCYWCDQLAQLPAANRKRRPATFVQRLSLTIFGLGITCGGLLLTVFVFKV